MARSRTNPGVRAGQVFEGCHALWRERTTFRQPYSRPWTCLQSPAFLNAQTTHVVASCMADSPGHVPFSSEYARERANGHASPHAQSKWHPQARKSKVLKKATSNRAKKGQRSCGFVAAVFPSSFASIFWFSVPLWYRSTSSRSSSALGSQSSCQLPLLPHCPSMPTPSKLMGLSS